MIRRIKIKAIDGQGGFTRRSVAAFTLIELLVVITIIAILATIGIPAVKGFGKSNAMTAADRQMLDDIAYARQRAIAGHTTVFMVFVPPALANATLFPIPNSDAVVSNSIKTLLSGQYGTYALLTKRSVGEQPGRSSPRYLTAWRSLPNGVFIATNKFDIYVPTAFDTVRAFPSDPTVKFDFPLSGTNTALNVSLPYLAFDYLGRLVSGKDEYIPLTRGSIFYQRDANGGVLQAPFDVQETPPGNSLSNSNVIHIDWLTGRARVEKQEIQ